MLLHVPSAYYSSTCISLPLPKPIECSAGTRDAINQIDGGAWETSVEGGAFSVAVKAELEFLKSTVRYLMQDLECDFQDGQASRSDLGPDTTKVSSMCVLVAEQIPVGTYLR